MNRSHEIRQLFRLPVAQLVKRSQGHLKVLPDLPRLYAFLADRMVREFELAAAGDRVVNFIMPVGPTQPYQLMAQAIRKRRLSLAKCRFFFMDEYCDDRDRLVPLTHPLSFRRQIGPLFFDLIPDKLLMPVKQRIFPTPGNLKDLPTMIRDLGGIEVCYGGIGIHGHLAFNEPEPGVKGTGPRCITINEFTRTVDCTRHGHGGNLINFPRRAITLGMREVLGARKLLLMTRNEATNFTWANTALRLAALGEPGDDYPVTHIRGHASYLIATDRLTAQAPKVVL